MTVRAHTPDRYEHRDLIAVRRALISVSDKRRLPELAAALVQAGVEIVSTGSTAQAIRDAGFAVSEVSEVTRVAEALDGRVKTLHPAIHAGVLADLRLASHREELARLHVKPFELVIVNLYPFQHTVAARKQATEIIEHIDIGGPALVRGAAKNHPNTAIVVSPERYDEVIEAVQGTGTTLRLRRALATEAFAHTAAYDTAVANWFLNQQHDGWESADQPASDPDDNPDGSGVAEHDATHDSSDAIFAETSATLDYTLSGRRTQVLRYGENSHQRAALFSEADGAGIAQTTQLHGKAMSYNNYIDADAALRAVYDHESPAVAIIKHANPCGIATAPDGSEDPIAAAYRHAHSCDPVSAFGGVVAANRIVTAGMAAACAKVFTEAIVAPGFAPEALPILTAKKNLRLLVLPQGCMRQPLELRQVTGGFLLQDADHSFAAAASWRLVSGAAADAQTLTDLEFAWRACRSVKSNAILLAADCATVGIGMGQVNRVDSCRLAVSRAGQRASGAVCASDAFFPFPDGLHTLIDAGVRAVVQPGGSVRDEEVIAAADAAGLTMYLTSERHFFH